jgi:mannitol/fructose-specific phosphotransferase system IIA component (Ntr-type)
LAESLEKHELYIYNYKKNYKNNHRKAIIALCITGEGAAINIKRLLEDVIPEINDNNIEIIPIGMIQSENVIENIKIMQKSKDIIAIVGTIDPNVENIPYYSMEKILNSDGLDELKELLFNNNPQKTQENKLKARLNDNPEETCKNKLKTKLIANNIFDENLIVLQASLKSKEEVLDTLSNLLLKYGYVKESFLLDLYKRELMAPTIFANGIAIPHTFPFHVIKPAIAIATLKKPVKWAENFFADKIFMFALNNNSSLVFRYLYNIGNNYSLLDKLIKCSNKRDFLDILLFNEQIQQDSLSSIHN